MNKTEVIAIIPARGGSKGIPKKNMVDLLGKPLIEYSINAAVESRSIQQIFVTSDDDQILNFAESKGVNGVKRPDRFSTDTASVIPVIKHVLDEIRNKDIDNMQEN